MSATVLNLLSGPIIIQRKGGAMKSNDQKKQARASVSDCLRLFFNRLRQQSTSSTQELWKRVEAKLREEKKQKEKSRGGRFGACHRQKGGDHDDNLRLFLS